MRSKSDDSCKAIDDLLSKKKSRSSGINTVSSLYLLLNVHGGTFSSLSHNSSTFSAIFPSFCFVK